MLGAVDDEIVLSAFGKYIWPLMIKYDGDNPCNETSNRTGCFSSRSSSMWLVNRNAIKALTNATLGALY